MPNTPLDGYNSPNKGTATPSPNRRLTLETQRISPNPEPGSLRGSDQLHPGTTLVNRYLIQGVIGVGGMGAVYRARDLHFPGVDKKVAVKEMINQAGDPVVRETIVRNFEREANLLATLSHPAIPRIYDYFTQGERSYLILEFIEGKDLESLMNETQTFLTEQQVINWAIELCDVLSYLHSHHPDPIVFRDMKPSNIMITPNQHVVLVDFGIAKPFQAGPKGTMIGTEGYSPPEQYRGEASPLADIYSLGATLHHVLSRRDPRLEAPFSFGERPLREINPSISVELENIVYTAIHYNPEHRFRNAVSMKEALIAAGRKTGVLNKVYVTSKSPVDEYEGTKLLWSFDCEDEIRGTPVVDQDTVYIGSYDNNLYALNASSGEFIWKYATDGGIVSKPAVFEGNIYFGSEDGRLHVVSARSGKIVWTYISGYPIRSSPKISEGHLFIGGDDGYLHAINAVTGRRAWRSEAGAHVRSTPLIIGENILFGTEAGELWCLDLGGSTRWRFRAKRAVTSSPACEASVVYFTSIDWNLYALDLKTGFLVWRYRMGKASISSPYFSENLIFAGCSDSKVYCLDSRTAKEVWTFSTEHQVTGSPVIYKDSLYIGSVDGFIYCLEFRTGRLRWKYRTNGPITGTAVVVNDIVYIGSTDHRIYALAA